MARRDETQEHGRDIITIRIQETIRNTLPSHSSSNVSNLRRRPTHNPEKDETITLTTIRRYHRRELVFALKLTRSRQIRIHIEAWCIDSSNGYRGVSCWGVY